MNYNQNDIAALFLWVESLSGLGSSSDDIMHVNRMLTPDEIDAQREFVRTIQQRSLWFVNAVEIMNNELRGGSCEETYQTIMYDIGKRTYGEQNLRRFFGDIYAKLGERVDYGPRVGQLISISGVDSFLKRMNRSVWRFSPFENFSDLSLDDWSRS